MVKQESYSYTFSIRDDLHQFKVDFYRIIRKQFLKEVITQDILKIYWFIPSERYIWRRYRYKLIHFLCLVYPIVKTNINAIIIFPQFSYIAEYHLIRYFYMLSYNSCYCALVIATNKSTHSDNRTCISPTVTQPSALIYGKLMENLISQKVLCSSHVSYFTCSVASQYSLYTLCHSSYGACSLRMVNYYMPCHNVP